MYLREKLFQFIICFIFIICIKFNLINTSVISDRNRTNSDHLSHSSSSTQFNSSIISINHKSNESENVIDTTIQQSNNEKKIIRTLVNDVNQTTVTTITETRKSVNSSIDERPSTNNILSEEMIDDYRMNSSDEIKNLELKNEIKLLSAQINDTSDNELKNKASNDLQFVDDIDLKLFDKVNQTLINEWIKENENIFNLQVSDTMDCMFVRSDEGVYSFQSDRNHTEVCALYLITEPNKLIEFEFVEFNVSCGDWSDSYPKNNKSLVSIVDGWEIKGEFFPGISDHLLKKNERYKEICMNGNESDRMIIRKKYHVSQNVGLIQFRVLNRYEGFKVRVRFIENPKPCNVVFALPQGIYTLKNYGQPVNCSVSILFPETITIISNSIITKPLMMSDDSNSHKPLNYYGYQLNKNQSQINFNDEKVDNSTLLISNTDDCLNKIDNNIIHDYVELRGGNGLDTDLMLVADKMCFVKELKIKKVEIACGNTAVRLISSGLFDNSVTIAFDLLESPHSESFKCPQKTLNG